MDLGLTTIYGAGLATTAVGVNEIKSNKKVVRGITTLTTAALSPTLATFSVNAAERVPAKTANAYIESMSLDELKELSSKLKATIAERGYELDIPEDKTNTKKL